MDLVNAQTALDDLLALLKIAAGPGQESKVAEHLTTLLARSGDPQQCLGDRRHASAKRE